MFYRVCVRRVAICRNLRFCGAMHLCVFFAVISKSNHCVTVVSIKGKTEFLGQYTSYICITMSVSIYSHAVFYFTYGNSNIIEHCLKARCHYQSFLCQRTLWQSFWWNFDSDNGQRNLWSKTLTNFDGIELHPIFLQTLMDFDGNQPIRILFWNEEMMFTKQKHMVIKRRGRENQ